MPILLVISLSENYISLCSTENKTMGLCADDLSIHVNFATVNVCMRNTSYPLSLSRIQHGFKHVQKYIYL